MHRNHGDPPCTDANGSWWLKAAGELAESDSEPATRSQDSASSTSTQLNRSSVRSSHSSPAGEAAIRHFCKLAHCDFDDLALGSSSRPGDGRPADQASDAVLNQCRLQPMPSSLMDSANFSKLIEEQMSAINKQAAQDAQDAGRTKTRPASMVSTSNSFSASSHGRIWSLQTAGLSVPGWEDFYGSLATRSSGEQSHDFGLKEIAHFARNSPSVSFADSSLLPANALNADQGMFSKKFCGETDSAAAAIPEWKHGMPSQMSQETQYAAHSNQDVYRGHNSFMPRFSPEESEATTEASTSSTRHEGWAPSPPRKKPRSQMLTSEKAVEIYKLRPSQMPVGTMLVAHAQEVRACAFIANERA